MKDMTNLVLEHLSELARSEGDALRLSAMPSQEFEGTYPRAISLQADVRASSPEYQDDPTRLVLQGRIEAWRELAVVMLLSALHGRRGQLVMPLAGASQYDCLVLEKNDFAQGVLVEQLRVHELSYEFAPQRFDDAPELFSDDGRNPYFGFAHDFGEAVKMGMLQAPTDEFSGVLVIGGTELSLLRLGRSILDLAHPSNPFRGSFSLERRRGQTSSIRCSADAEFVIAEG